MAQLHNTMRTMFLGQSETPIGSKMLLLSGLLGRASAMLGRRTGIIRPVQR
jgi:hypothetical protein